MSGRPKRARTVPTRYGEFAAEAEADFDAAIKDYSDDEIQEVAPRKTRRIKQEPVKEEPIDLTQPSSAAPTPTQLRAPPLPSASPDPQLDLSDIPLPKEPGPRKTITLTTAKTNYKLIDADLSGLTYDTQENPHGAFFAPMRLYKALDCWKVAMVKHGSPEGLQVALAKSRQRGSKAKATRDLHAKEKADIEKRRREVRQLLDVNGVPGRYLDTNAEILFYISSGVGDLSGIMIKVKEEAEEACQQECLRVDTVRQLLHANNLFTATFESLPVFQTYIKTGYGLEEAMRTHSNNLAKQREKDARLAALNKALLAVGVLTSDGSSHPTFADYMKGKESLDIALPRYRDIVTRELQKVERTNRIAAALQAERLWNYGQYFIHTTFQNYLLTGDEIDFATAMEAMRALCNSGRNIFSSNGGINSDFNLKNLGASNRSKKTSVQNVCSVQGCNKICSLKCPDQLCGVHKDQCTDPACKKHGKFPGK